MKKHILNLFFLIFFALLISNATQAGQVFVIDKSHSYVSWKILHLGFSKQTGKWFVTGKVNLNEKEPVKSMVDIKIKIADLVTGIAELNKHLMGEQFFNIKKYPIATFLSKKVKVTGKSTAKVTGLLNLHGITKPVTLDVSLNKMGVNLIRDKLTVGFSAHGIIKRSDFGMETMIPLIGDKIELTIEVEAFKK